ncbi:MAG: polysaccharide biosynthesis protein [Clostridia bacterium]|nr:polysaccharide biosynthesis protein [Clostridia bacterium]
MSKFRNVILIILDLLCILIAYFLGVILISNDTIFDLSSYYTDRLTRTFAISAIVYQAVFHITKRYKRIIRYENSKDYLEYIALCVISSIIVSVIREIFNLHIATAKLNILAGIFIGIMMVSYRIIARYILVFDVVNKGIRVSKENRKNLLIIGAGNASHEIINTIKTTMNEKYNIIGIIDDNKRRLGFTVSGVKIIGNRNDIPKVCEENNVDLIFFSIANIDNENKKQILNICQSTKAKVRILPGLKEIIRDKKLFENLRDVEIEDLLGREPVKLDNKNIESLIKNKVVLVTGGGGSIGSELCRQIVKYNPEKLVMLDIYENSLYDIELELKAKYPKIKIEAIIASIRDKKRLESIFEKYNPYLVFHAAAHKHVPLMENNPLEAIKNNVFGTYNLVNISDKYKVKRFIQISTDKAVNPTNIMGATKRLCEMIVQAKNKESETEFAAVRFGNVLGSNGSVVPLFKKQIAEGGPVTVTHKEITRFFMTIPEAVGLVLQAMTYAKGGEIFVLDMGEPVKIYDLAISLIKLSGLVPGEDIEVKFTGLRPGEKLYEELLMGEEGLEKTAHNKIFVAEPLDITVKDIEEKLERFEDILKLDENQVEKDKVKNIMKSVVPTYKEPDEVNKK